MKISAYHKSLGDDVEMLNHLCRYDKVYASKTFSFTPDVDDFGIVKADEIERGGTGYCISVQDGRETFDRSKNKTLSREIEYICPDYDLFPDYPYAAGFLTRGCPRNCGFCVVGKKEGLCSRQVADLDEFWRGQNEIKLLDPNLLACREHEEILQQLIKSNAQIDFTQGLDIRLVTSDNLPLLDAAKTKMVHFAWDNPKQDLTKHFAFYAENSRNKDPRKRTVYVLTNYDSTIEQDLYRIYTLRDLGYWPYVMIYNKESAPREIRLLQRWCNNKFIFKSCPSFYDYDPKKG